MREPPAVAVVGATGAVGRELVAILFERGLPHRELRLLASARSAGSSIEAGGREHGVRELTESSFDGVDLAFFAAGAGISRQFAPIAASRGCIVIDNSSTFRLDPETPLVVPEINGDELAGHRGIIANPNCSTILLCAAVGPLHRKVGITRIVLSTYQAASGAGAAAMAELEQQARDWANGRALTEEIFGRQYLWNVFSHESEIDGATGYNLEESKMIEETRRILKDPGLRMTATCVRVPVLRVHCESVNLTFDRPLSADEARGLLAAAPGVALVDDRAANRHPEPVDASHRDDILVGRIRQDLSQEADRGLEMFLCGDQLRKGAALNAIQIAERIGS